MESLEQEARKFARESRRAVYCIDTPRGPRLLKYRRPLSGVIFRAEPGPYAWSETIIYYDEELCEEPPLG